MYIHIYIRILTHIHTILQSQVHITNLQTIIQNTHPMSPFPPSIISEWIIPCAHYLVHTDRQQADRQISVRHIKWHSYHSIKKKYVKAWRAPPPTLPPPSSPYEDKWTEVVGTQVWGHQRLSNPPLTDWQWQTERVHSVASSMFWCYCK